ncbi:ATP-dependent DNA ligase [Streptomyces sp. NBC_00299]|uniref:ATP-dependent DNA ligase n=1 Tax=Streptomyces sp. NBC_00299 TaxID=2975705 RepID=UPI002E28CA2E|nr:DNA ligase [Streptomyces sp. NBC_00299]
MDLAVAAMRLPPGVILDGEAVVYLASDDGTVHISFAAAQSRALSRPRHARELADQHPATYVAFNLLAHPAAGFADLRPRPYVERRQVLLDLLADVGPPIVPVWSTTDLDEALLWYETLEGTGVEGIVAKPLRSAYKTGRVWAKVRHADTVDATVVGFTARPAIRRPLPYGCPTDGWRCPSGLPRRSHLPSARAWSPRPGGRSRRPATPSYTPAIGDVMVEVVAGTTRHAVVTVMRLR